jgi:hypothetical protein
MLEYKSDLDMISYLTNPAVRSSIKHIAKRLNPNSLLNTFLLNYYTELAPGYTPEADVVASALSHNSFNEVEVSEALAKLARYSTISREGAKSLINSFYRYYKRTKLREAHEIFSERREEHLESAEDDFLEEISRLHRITGSEFELINLAEEDLSKLIDTEVSGVNIKIPSKFNIVRQSCNHGAYCKGWIVQVAAPPGVMKTQLMLNEVIFWATLGIKTVWVALGDMTRGKFLVRIACILNKASAKEVTNNARRYITPEVIQVFQNIRFIIKNAHEMTASELVNNVQNIDPNEFDYSTVVIDYDDNLLPEYDNMYLEGGNAYSEFTRLAKKDGVPDKLVMVASQVKQELWSTEKLPERCIAQSSAKQARVDLMMCGNRNSVNPNIGTLVITKNRDGDLMDTKYMKDSYGNFMGISDMQYRDMLADRDSVPAVKSDSFNVEESDNGSKQECSKECGDESSQASSETSCSQESGSCSEESGCEQSQRESDTIGSPPECEAPTEASSEGSEDDRSRDREVGSSS